MKKLILSLIFVTSISALSAQAKTDSLYVEGVCKMCKERIEKYAYGKGVKLANWDKESGYLKLVYKEDKTSLKEIAERVASIGHENALCKRNDEAYEKLPGCCQYDSVEKH